MKIILKTILKFNLVLFIFSLFIGCAKPTYVQEGATDKDLNQKMESNNCQQKIKDYCLKLYWTQLPNNEEDPGELQIRFYQISDSDQFPVLVSPVPNDQDQLKIKFWMDMGNGKGHGTAPVTVAAINDLKNTFKVTDIYLIMRGQWKIQMELIQNQTVNKWEQNFDF